MGEDTGCPAGFATQDEWAVGNCFDWDSSIAGSFGQRDLGFRVDGRGVGSDDCWPGCGCWPCESISSSGVRSQGLEKSEPCIVRATESYGGELGRHLDGEPAYVVVAGCCFADARHGRIDGQCRTVGGVSALQGHDGSGGSQFESQRFVRRVRFRDARGSQELGEGKGCDEVCKDGNATIGVRRRIDLCLALFGRHDENAFRTPACLGAIARYGNYASVSDDAGVNVQDQKPIRTRGQRLRERGESRHGTRSHEQGFPRSVGRAEETSQRSGKYLQGLSQARETNPRHLAQQASLVVQGPVEEVSENLLAG